MRLAATHPELFDRAQWSAATPERREQIARAVAELLAPEFSLAGLHCYAGTDLEIAVYLHAPTSAQFSLIPGGEFEMGMSPEEEQAIVDARPEVSEDEDDFDQEFDLLLSEMGTMRPLHTVRVRPFLLAQHVLTVGQIRRWLDGFVDPLYGGEPGVPAHLSVEQETAVLIATALRPPSEAELEYAARGHLRRTLLPTRTTIPDEDFLETMLADTGDHTSNAFGVHGYGLYPERCADAWHEHFKGAPTDGSAWPGSGPRVVRGGAANCYPWQDCGEWNVMLCAFRQSDHAAEFGAALRPARSLLPGTEHEATGASTKVAGKKTSSTKGASNKAASKKTPSNKTASKTTASTKGASKKTASKKTASKKTASKNTASKKTASKKTASKKTASKKTASKKTASKTTASKKTASKKTASKKTASKKTASKKTAAKTAPAKKTTSKTAPAKTPTSKKTTSKQSSTDASSSKTTPPRKPAAKRPAPRS